MEFFENISEIGRGTSAVVYKVRNIETNEFFALKSLFDLYFPIENILEEFHNSVIVPCANIVPCYAMYKYSSKYYFLQELMHTNLENFVTEDNQSTIEEIVIAYILREITQGLLYLHSNHKIHRDLKPGNVFINESGHVKIGDFGMSATLTQERKNRETFAGSPLYMAPEILNRQNYNELSDIWSLGIIAYELAVKEPPYNNSKSLDDLIKKIRTNSEPQLSSP